MFHILNIENIMMATRFLNFKPELSCIPPGPGPNEMYGSSESYEVGGELSSYFLFRSLRLLGAAQA